MLRHTARVQIHQSSIASILRRSVFSEVSGIFKESTKSVDNERIPAKTDIAIVGGGIIGSSVAYWLKQRTDKSCHVSIIERDPLYTTASTVLSVGGLRHQFKLPENIQMSVFTSEFLRGIKHHLTVLNDDPPDVQFNHQGYLFLYPREAAEEAEKQDKLQRELGANVELLNRTQLRKKFPWLRLDGVEVASYGVEGQGWFDPWLLLNAFTQKNLELDVAYIKGEVVGFNTDQNSVEKRDVLKSMKIRDELGDVSEMAFDTCINCAGPWAAEIAKLAGIGIGSQDTQLPVQPRKRYVFVFDCPRGPGPSTPLVVDPSGAYFRREGLGGFFICGKSPEENEEPNCDNLDVDYNFFDEKVWPLLAERVKQFQKLKVKSAWAGYYDYNTLDQNIIIGRHPRLHNFVFANGMSGHGLQQSAAIGRAVMELIFDGSYQTIDLSRLGFERIINKQLLSETAIV